MILLFLGTVFKKMCLEWNIHSAGLKLKPSKYIFFQTNDKFLGHVVSEERNNIDPDKIKAVKDWSRPKTPFSKKISDVHIQEK